jgi:type IV pilus assembly protein PilE
MKKALTLRVLEGFTLLELLVVIGIISIIIAVGTVSYSTAQKKARDAKRKGDLSSAQKSLEQCYSVNSYQYPTITNASGTITINPLPSACTNFSIIDPLNNATYKYTITTSTSTYSISTCLESDACATPYSVSQQQ